MISEYRYFIDGVEVEWLAYEQFDESPKDLWTGRVIESLVPKYPAEVTYILDGRKVTRPCHIMTVSEGASPWGPLFRHIRTIQP